MEENQQFSKSKRIEYHQQDAGRNSLPASCLRQGQILKKLETKPASAAASPAAGAR